MTSRLGRIVPILLVALLSAHAVFAADRPIRLKNRTFVPPATAHQVKRMAPRHAPGRAHYLVQFDGRVTPDRIRALAAAGIRVLRRVPDDAVAVAAPAGFDGAGIDGVRWVGQLEAGDKISRDTARDLLTGTPRHPFTVVEFFPDVDAQTAADAVTRAGGPVVYVPGLPGHLAVTSTSAAILDALAADDRVAWIYPASDRLVSGAPAAVCDALDDGTAIANFASEGDGWDGPGANPFRLGYLFSTPSTDLPAADQAWAISRAMTTWSRYVALDWVQAASATAPATVNILWGPVNHGDGFPFGDNVLAHTFYPAPITSEPLAGDMHFNDTFLWGTGQPDRYDVFSVALHELGHALGLAHSSDPDSVMYPSYSGVRTDLAPVDVATIQHLYAPRTSSLPANFTTSDVGAVSVPGSVSMNAAGDQATLQASGADVWGTADAFTFVSRPLDGDGDIIARVDSIAAVQRWTKAGVMIRDGRDPSAAHAFMLVSGGKGLAFQRRRTFGGITVSTDGIAGAAPYWVRLSRRGDRFDAYASPNGSAWTLIGTDTIHMSTTVDAGLALTAHLDGALASASFSSFAVTASLRWSSKDIGAVPLAGSFVNGATSLTLTGAGEDIWGTADAFRFAWVTMSGDGEIAARVDSVDYADAWSKAGVMIRASLAANSSHAFMLVSAGKGYAFQRRDVSGGPSVNTSGGAGGAPAWVRLVRKGNTFSAYVSQDGGVWRLVGTDTISMGATVYAGLAVTSHSATARTRAVFEKVSVR